MNASTPRSGSSVLSEAKPYDTAERMYDAIVVGAGPGGGAAALELARRGRSVLLIERATLPRYKP